MLDHRRGSRGMDVMEPIRLMVVDLYHGDRVASFARARQAGIYGIIHKASEGAGHGRAPPRARRAGGGAGRAPPRGGRGGAVLTATPKGGGGGAVWAHPGRGRRRGGGGGFRGPANAG